MAEHHTNLAQFVEAELNKAFEAVRKKYESSEIRLSFIPPHAILAVPQSPRMAFGKEFTIIVNTNSETTDVDCIDITAFLRDVEDAMLVPTRKSLLAQIPVLFPQEWRTYDVEIRTTTANRIHLGNLYLKRNISMAFILE